METWKDVQGYEGLYQISNQGRVRSLDRIIEQPHPRKSSVMFTVFYKGRVLSPWKGDYFSVGLYRNNEATRRHIHALVLETFKGLKPQNKNEARHLNGDPYDNRLENLEWGTYREQKEDQKQHGRFFVPKAAKGEDHHKSKLKYHDVIAIKHGLQLGVKQTQLATYFNVTRGLICSIKHGRIWKDV